MKVDVEVISAVEKKLVVELPADAVDTALGVQYKRLSKTARVKGFRPGKVPSGLIRKMFRKEAQNGALQTLIQEHIEQALKEGDVTPLSFPNVDRDELVEGQPFTFSLVCQVRPEIELKGLDAIEVERPTIDINDDVIAESIEALREQHAELEPVEGEGADTGHSVTIDYVGTLKGEDEPFEGGTGADHAVELGSGQLVPGFEDQLMGTKVGDEVTVELSFPEDYVDELAGKEATFAVTVKSIHRKVLADVDDDFAVDLGHEDLSAMRASIYDRLYNEQMKEQDANVREAILKSLMTANEIEVPQALVSNAEMSLKQQLGMHLAMSGVPREHLAQAMEAEKENLEVRAKELAHRDLLLDAVAKHAGIEVSDEDVDSRIGEIAANANQPKAKVRANLQNNNRMDSLRVEIEHEQSLKWLEELALSEKNASDDSTADSDSGNAEDTNTDEAEDSAAS